MLFRSQNEMGLREVMNKYSSATVFNEGSFDEYYDVFVDRYNSDLVDLRQNIQASNYKKKPRALEDAILMAMLINDSDFLTTTEIAKLINCTYSDINLVKNKNNVSRYFNQNFHPYFEAKKVNNVNKYRLSQTGKMHARWLLSD